MKAKFEELIGVWFAAKLAKYTNERELEEAKRDSDSLYWKGYTDCYEEMQGLGVDMGKVM